MVQLYASVDPYPLARPERGQGIPSVSGQLAAIAAPRVFNWAFHARTAGAERVTVVSRRVVGPAFVDTLQLDWNFGGPAGVHAKYNIGHAVSAPTEGPNLPLTEPANTTWWTEEDFADDGGFTQGPSEGFYTGMDGANVNNTLVRFGRAVQAPEFFVVFSIRQPAGLVCIANGVLRILENVDPELLADLVTS